MKLLLKGENMDTFIRTNLRSRIFSLIAMALSAGCLHSWANVLVNGSFELPAITPGTYSTYFIGDSSSIPGWTVTGLSGTNVAINDALACCGISFDAYDGAQMLDLTGTDDNSTVKGIEQTVTGLTPGQFVISFAVGNVHDAALNPYDSAVELFLNGVSQGVYTNSNQTPGSVNWETFSPVINIPGATATIEFRNAPSGGGTEIFTGLDAVSLNSAVPEPATMSLVASAAILLLMQRRRPWRG